MSGGDIFNFTLKSVHALVLDTLEISNTGLSDYDAFLFHQANLFMLKHLAKKSGIPLDKFLINIDKFGNTSSASIPLLMTTRLSSNLASRVLLCGFGVGYSWGAASLKLDKEIYLEHIDYE